MFGNVSIGMIWKKAVTHPIRVMVAGTGVLLSAAAIVLGFLALRDLQRIELIRVHIERTIQARRVTERLLSTLLDHQTAGEMLDSTTVAELSTWMEDLSAMQGGGLPDSSGVESLRYVLEGDDVFSDERLLRGLALARDIAGGEIGVQQRLLEQTERDTRSEVALAVAIIGGLLVTLLLGGWMVRRRFLKPLEDLRGLFYALAERDFRAVSIDDIDPILIPLFENFNFLVTRLEILENEHRSRARTLEGEVRKATQTLLEQHRSLANAERLAVVGEMAAGVAHELRNPLAGISMSLGNLRQEVSEPDVAGRLDILISEIDRITRLLEHYLSSARHAPEQTQRVDVGVLVADLLNLLQYQIPVHIRLEGKVPKGIQCVLPRDRVRQMLLNLVLNSVEAFGENEGLIVVSALRNGSRLNISVCDDGPGFPQEMLRGHMRAFATHREAGTGLGLIMVRRVVEELGGGLELANQEPHGACVNLSFPVSNG